MSQRYLTALPVYNELHHVDAVLDEVLRYSSDVLVVDDGSSDGTSQRLAERRDIQLVAHQENRGYGAALQTAFDYAVLHRYDILVTIDCDGQHQPQRIPQFVAACQQADVVSGSRYLEEFSGDSAPPPERKQINVEITHELNRRLGLQLTDAFCGFKAYRTAMLSRLELSETGYAMPLELWVQVAHHDLQVIELPVPLIYLEEERSFGGALDDGRTRLQYYRSILDRSIAATQQDVAGELPLKNSFELNSRSSGGEARRGV